MSAVAVELIDLSKELLGVENDSAFDSAGQGVGPFSDRDDQPIALPTHLTGAEAIKVSAPLKVSTAALGHGPSLLAWAVERDVDGTVVLRVDDGALSSGSTVCRSVVRRKDTAYKNNDRDAVLAAVA